jgi:hypothetical protein
MEPLGSTQLEDAYTHVPDGWLENFETLTYGHPGTQRHNSCASSFDFGLTSNSSGDFSATYENANEHEPQSRSLLAPESSEPIRQFGSDNVDKPLPEYSGLVYTSRKPKSASIGFACVTEQKTGPPMEADENGCKPRKQSPRFVGDQYTPGWTLGDGIERAGWCGECGKWHKLKDSAYWYHVSRHCNLLLRRVLTSRSDALLPWNQLCNWQAL